jgi:glutaminyl-peptide cyclotransferase
MKKDPKRRLLLWCAAAVLPLLALVWPPVRAAAAEKPARSAPVARIRIVRAFPHDASAYTQGLLCSGGFFFESTGLYGQSTLRKVEIETGRVVKQAALESIYFAEGLALWRGKLVQLTWQTHTGFVWSMESFAKEGVFTYPNEGWGLTHDADSLIMSDGTSKLTFLDPESFQAKKQLEVLDGSRPVVNLNELEMVRGEIWANIWTEDFVARISPETGRVLGWLDLSVLRAELPLMQQVDVLNGIACDAETGRIFVTGKLWPKVFEIEVVEGGKKP